jgi:hypothetical protein
LGIKLAHAIHFNQDVLRNIEFDYVKVKINPEQANFIKDISCELCEEINIPILAMRGSIFNALSNWQIENHRVLEDIVTESFEERLRTAKEIFNIGKQKLKEVLLDPKNGDEILLDIAFERAFKKFITHLIKLHS